MANHSRRKQRNEPIRNRKNTCNQRQAQENACEQVTTGFDSHWSRKWRVCFFLNQSQSQVIQTQLNTNANHVRHSIENCSDINSSGAHPHPPRANPRALALFLFWVANSRGWGLKKRANAPLPGYCRIRFEREIHNHNGLSWSRFSV